MVYSSLSPGWNTSQRLFNKYITAQSELGVMYLPDRYAHIFGQNLPSLIYTTTDDKIYWLENVIMARTHVHAKGVKKLDTKGVYCVLHGYSGPTMPNLPRPCRTSMMGYRARPRHSLTSLKVLPYYFPLVSAPPPLRLHSHLRSSVITF